VSLLLYYFMWSAFWLSNGKSSRKILSLESWESIKSELALSPSDITSFKQSKYDKPSDIPEFGYAQEHTGILLRDYLLITNDLMDE
jgi:hypothetical protein